MHILCTISFSLNESNNSPPHRISRPAKLKHGKLKAYDYNERTDRSPSIDRWRDLLGEDMVPHLYLVIRGRMPMSSLGSLLIDMVRRLMGGGLIMLHTGT